MAGIGTADVTSSMPKPVNDGKSWSEPDTSSARCAPDLQDYGTVVQDLGRTGSRTRSKFTVALPD